MSNVPTICAEDVRIIIDAAVAHAEQIGVPACVAVVDNGGNPKALFRMDGASFLTLTGAIRKAVAAAGLGTATKDFTSRIADEPALLATFSAMPGVSLLAGGIPVVVEGVTAGAVGVAGGPGAQDQSIAEAGLAALTSSTVTG
jgi:uncharacterized protein GlcG (DUF336 family)